MKVPIASMPKVQCKHCPAVYHGSEQSARLAGWRIWRGTTLGGTEAEDVVCAACAGNISPDGPDEAAAASWRVSCDTCHWVYEDEYDEGPLTPKQAKSVARDHQCEPEVQIAPPAGDEWYDEYWVNDDGTLKPNRFGR